MDLRYNLYDPDNYSPYGDRLAVRFGFEFPMKKKQKVKRLQYHTHIDSGYQQYYNPVASI